MKLIKLSVLLALAVVMTMAATGCKKSLKNPTPLPGSGKTTVGDGTIPDGDKIAPPDGEPPVLTKTWDPSKWNQDRLKWAPYTVFFAYDSSSVREGELTKIDSVAAAMQADPSVNLLIEGHCDERGTEEYNRSLGDRRALSLREELVKRGMNPDRIQVITYGEDKPAVQGHDESAWTKNRRGEFIACTPK